MSNAKIAYVLMDSADPGQIVPFWSELLGVGVAATVGDGDFVVLEPGGEGMPALAFQRVPDAKVGKNRMHLDLVVEDLEAATQQITDRGGVWLDGETRQIGGYRWRCMSDPQGNEFDIVPDDN
jgi:predicted enzyme related to lactoylglutathione lyase